MRVYLVGAGVIARTHVEAAAKLDGPIEFRVADVSPAMLAAFGEAYPDIPRYPDAASMLAEPAREDDIVIVATPPFAHLEPTLQAFASGRHVLCEKPLAMSTDEAERMLDAAEAAGRLLGCCSVRFRGLPHTETVKRVLNSGVLGELTHLSWVNKWARSRSGIEYQPASRWFLDRSKSGGGVLMDWGPYDLATLTDLFAPDQISVTAATTSRPVTSADPSDTVFDVETAAAASLVLHRAAGDLLVDFQRASGTHGEEIFRAELEGTRGSVRWAPFDSEADVILRTDEGDGPVERVADPEPRAPFTIFDYPLKHFVDAVRGRPSRALLGREAVDAFRTVRALYEVAATGEPASIPFGDQTTRTVA
ncbi:Gfo/Idh/MocA family protein [Leifsonia sp. 2TAF2]|uniref:Gfo/Idh/MocA family protein n=1 Tax=Leifsonia sp. 2TAF2 TaxID=3233009 RepID=UPI003F9B7C5A